MPAAASSWVWLAESMLRSRRQTVTLGIAAALNHVMYCLGPPKGATQRPHDDARRRHAQCNGATHLGGKRLGQYDNAKQARHKPNGPHCAHKDSPSDPRGPGT
jgi:hypothetical protein